ncbi:hypothetical protein COU14_02370 [Candidatus Kaiserbacteria bacterium CG10_big_fil_rev_8_21_14_0_10_44_10]|uniref:Uncharacterized protein n=1 Tax=Candidatus Kaiserbacteria bacterium CG10_big_fil_rev_8_21_14_0_10_44_10 TaxID=1974606 RepID=A0A2H0UHE5_9BACT|nr:MAG: hypothetical protein COU14_02370 [Candidatus Kaiserbacteria bacterium CG10_big_fil_rev_8_21_14_0_10_44_10]
MSKTNIHTSFLPFHAVFAQRIAGIDIMNPSSVPLAKRIAEDATIKVPADKILSISESLLNKMIDVQASDTSAYVGQVMPFLEQADIAIKAQIASYRKHGELSDDIDNQLNMLDDAGNLHGVPDSTRAEGIDPAFVQGADLQTARTMNGATDHQRQQGDGSVTRQPAA